MCDHEKFRKSYEYVMIGTGLPECILFGSICRNIKKCLALDGNSFYGSSGASFTFNQLKSLLTKYTLNYDSKKPLINIQDVIIHENEQHSQELIKNDKKFNIDLLPNVIYYNGKYISKICEAKISDYSTFRLYSRIFIYMNDEIRLIPCTRQLIFTSTKLTLIEKRSVSHFFIKLRQLKDLSDTELIESTQNLKYIQFITNFGLNTDLAMYIIAFSYISDENIDALNGLKQSFRVIDSMLYQSPFMLCDYGFGDICEHFLRYAALYLGESACSFEIKDIMIEEDRITHVILSCGCTIGIQNNLIINTETLLQISKNVPQLNSYVEKSDSQTVLSRAIYISKKSLTYVDNDNHNSICLHYTEYGCIKVYEITESNIAPKNTYLHQFVIDANISNENFTKEIDKIYHSTQITNCDIMWYAQFKMLANLDVKCKIKNVLLVPDQVLNNDFDDVIQQIEKIYSNLSFKDNHKANENIQFMQKIEPVDINIQQFYID